ncbi:MAG TPA: flagellar protein FliT [Methylophilaceae bacterium]|jgi:flagellar protein FliT
MTNAELNLYADVAGIAERMLAATQAEDWELLEQLEATCASHIERLRVMDTPPLTREELRQKVAYIERILETDRQIRRLIEPWMARLSDLMQSSGTRRKLHNTYVTGSAY